MDLVSHADPLVVDKDGYVALEADEFEPPPLVVVEGFLGGACGALLWGAFSDYLNESSIRAGKTRRRSMFPRSACSVVVLHCPSSCSLVRACGRVGPVSSLHDRACELFFALKGGTGT
jgi:hypothetical protein